MYVCSHGYVYDMSASTSHKHTPSSREKCTEREIIAEAEGTTTDIDEVVIVVVVVVDEMMGTHHHVEITEMVVEDVEGTTATRPEKAESCVR